MSSECGPSNYTGFSTPGNAIKTPHSEYVGDDIHNLLSGDGQTVNNESECQSDTVSESVVAHGNNPSATIAQPSATTGPGKQSQRLKPLSGFDASIFPLTPRESLNIIVEGRQNQKPKPSSGPDASSFPPTPGDSSTTIAPGKRSQKPKSSSGHSASTFCPTPGESFTMIAPENHIQQQNPFSEPDASVFPPTPDQTPAISTPTRQTQPPKPFDITLSCDPHESSIMVAPRTQNQQPKSLLGQNFSTSPPTPGKSSPTIVLEKQVQQPKPSLEPELYSTENNDGALELRSIIENATENDTNTLETVPSQECDANLTRRGGTCTINNPLEDCCQLTTSVSYEIVRYLSPSLF